MTSKRSIFANFAVRVLAPSLVAATGIATLLLYIVNGIFDETNRLDAQYARQSANSAIGSVRESLETTLRDNAVWDDAVDNISLNFSVDWLTLNWGDATTGGIYDAVFVLQPDGKTLYGAHNGEVIKDEALDYFGRDLALLINGLPQDAGVYDEASGIIRIGDKISVVAVSPILPFTEGRTITPEQKRLLVFSKAFDDELVAQLSRRFALGNLKLSDQTPATSNAYAILNPSGEKVGYLSWEARNPGEIIRSKYGMVMTMIMVMFLFVILVLIYMSWKGFREAHASQTEAIAKSLRDDLTGLANRRELLMVLSSRLAEAREKKFELSVVYADLDGFKEVNDSYGHEIGDLLLKSAAAGFAHLAQGADVVARLGGDEFAIILSGEDCVNRTRSLARNMIAFLSEPMSFAGRVASVSVSVGLVDLEADEADAEEIIRRADVAMYAAKNAGRNRFFVYNKSLDYKRDENRAIAKSLREHIDQGSLTVVYQPIVDARTRRIRGVEALVRWPRDARSYYTPDVFIPVAEEFGLIEDLGYFVLTEACRQAAQWRDIFVAVNVSPIQFMNPGFADLVERTLYRTGLAANRLEVEVTEGFIIDNADRANAIINKLHEMRVGVALDDFGTGFSSIGHLRRFKFDKLKLDRSMVADILKQPSALRLVQGTVAMADALGLNVVAEGIEDENQVSVLRLAGVSQFQGYLFSKPVDARQIHTILAANTSLAAAS